MSLTSSRHKPKQDKGFSDDINNDINDVSQNLMSSPEASTSKGYDVNDVNDVKNSYLSVALAIQP